MEYTTEDLGKLVGLCDGHPFNANYLVEEVKEYTLPVVLGNPSSIVQWKRRRANEFLQHLTFSTEECLILTALREFSALDFDTLAEAVGLEISALSNSIIRLMDYHIVESSSDTYFVAPPVRDAVDRDPRFTVTAARHREMLSAVSSRLITSADDSTAPISMVEAGILAALQEERELPPLFSAFLLPSHLVWLARRKYDKNHIDPEVIRLARVALDSRQRLSPAGRAEACRLLCLTAARRGQDSEFEHGMQILRSVRLEPWERSNLNFLLGFNARMHGNLPEAEEYFRLSYQDSPRNFQAARELAAICLVRGNHDDAERFAREAFEIAQDSAYILDILLGVLIRSDRARVKSADQEIQSLFDRLKLVGEEEGRSFYTTRRAEYELRWGNKDTAARLIDEAMRRSPWIFNVRALRAEIYLERGNYTVAREELDRLYGIVNKGTSGERLTNLRAYLVLRASYESATGNYQVAKQIYSNRDVFTEREGQEAIKRIEIEQSYRRNS